MCPGARVIKYFGLGTGVCCIIILGTAPKSDNTPGFGVVTFSVADGTEPVSSSAPLAGVMRLHSIIPGVANEIASDAAGTVIVLFRRGLAPVSVTTPVATGSCQLKIGALVVRASAPVVGCNW